MLGEQAREKMAVQTVQIVHSVANAELRVQIQQQMHIAKRPSKVEKDGPFVSEAGELYAQIHGDRRSTDPSLGTHHHNQLALRWEFFRVQILRNSRQQIF